MLTTVLIIGAILAAILNICLICYILADSNIFFTRVPEGEFIVVTFSEKVVKYIGNVDGYWINPETGEVFNETETPKPDNLPKDVLGSGIYPLGFWPFAERYSYEFHWNKWTKPINPATGGEEKEYAIVPRSEIVDSVYFRAQYPVQVSGCETSEGVPLTMTVLVTVEITHVGTALFKIKTPGWLSALTGQIAAVLRDWNGRHRVIDITNLQAEIPGNGDKSEFQRSFLTLNDSKVGNPSIVETLGVRIVAISFKSYSIDTVVNDLQRASIEAYNAARTADAKVIKAQGDNAAQDAVSEQRRKTVNDDAYEVATKAEAKRTASVLEARGRAEAARLEGAATAEAAKLLADAVMNNPHAGTIAIAQAIERQQKATTLILGSSVMPTVQVKEDVK